tara:strand:- start:464 stop:1330 length:867 start_codon:yes stop_codon:yes gene_type:complete
MNDLVSIIINCYNGEKFLSRCLQSVIDQNYKNWEIIFWNNNSTDNSKKIFQSFKDKRFNYYESTKLTNLSIARNFAILKSKGKFISFIDVDDYWENDKLSKQIAFFEKNKNISLLFSNFYFENSQQKNKRISIKKKIPKNNLINFLLSKYPVSISTVIFNKEIIKDCLFNEKYHCIGDFDFVMKTSLDYDICGIDEPLAVISIHEENETKKRYGLFVLELLHWYKNCNRKFLNFINFLHYKFNIRYELAKYCLLKKKYKSLKIVFTKLSTKFKIKIIFIILMRLLKLN